MEFIVLGILVLGIGSFVLQGLVKIPADPPHEGIRTIWGEPKYEWDTVKPGWRFFPLYMWLTGFLDVEVVEVNGGVAVKTRTPDNQEVEVKVEYTFVPDLSSPQSRREFIMSGKGAGAREQFDSIVTERIREWCNSPEEGPQTWVEARMARAEIIFVLFRAIVNNIPRINSDIPTPILMKYFSVPPKAPLPSEEKKWGKKWSKVKKALAPLPPDELAALEAQVKERVALVNDVRHGIGGKRKEGLGIIVKRLNVGEVMPVGKMTETANRMAEEEQERKAEELEIGHLKKQVKLIAEELGVTPEQAIETFQTERGKVAKSVTESKWNISAETRDMIERITPQIAARITEALKERKEGDK